MLIPATTTFVPATAMLIPTTAMVIPATAMLIPVTSMLIPATAMVVPATAMVIPATAMVVPVGMRADSPILPEVQNFREDEWLRQRPSPWGVKSRNQAIARARDVFDLTISLKTF